MQEKPAKEHFMIKQKNLFKLIAVAISVVVVAIACSNKPTAVNSFSLDPVRPY